jgi:hydrogenase expression/formation protein HypC
MCLAVPAQVVETDGDEALVDLHGNRVQVCTVLAPEAGVGDWVLVHAGFAIQRLDAEEAEATWAILEDLNRCAEEEDIGAGTPAVPSTATGDTAGPTP